MPDNEMRPAPSPSVELWRPDGPAARAEAAIVANVVAGFKESLVPVLRGVRCEARALCNVETLKREGRCR